MSQVLTTPSESSEKARLSFACRLTDLIGARVRGVGSELGTIGSAGEVPICQNLIDLSLDAEMREREEGKIREVMISVCPMRV